MNTSDPFRNLASFKHSLALILAAILLAVGSLAYAADEDASDSSDATDAAQIDPANRAAYAALLNVLENEDTRDQFISELRQLSGDTPSGEASLPASQTDPAADTAEHDPDLRTVVTTRLQKAAAKIKQDTSIAWFVMGRLITNRPIPGVTLDGWQPAFVSLLFVIAAVVVARLVLSLAVAAGYRRLAAWATRERPAPAPEDPSQTQRRHRHHRRSQRLQQLASGHRSRMLIATIAGLALEVVVSLLASLAGYAALIALSGSGSGVSLFAMLFLTAFFAIEVLKALSRAVFGVRDERLRLVPVQNVTAQYWHRWLSAIISMTGYTLLLLVPMVQTVLTPSVGRVLGLLLMLLIYLYAVSVIWTKRHSVRDSLLHLADGPDASAVLGTLTRILARIWHWLVLVYFTVLLVVSQTDQQAALSFMAGATLQSAVAIAVGAVLVVGLSTLTARRLTLGGHWHKALPSFETRINTYIPVFLRGVRLIIVLAVILTVFDAWRAFNLAEWLQSSAGQTTISMIIHVGIILLIAALGWTVLASIIEHRLDSTNTRRRPSEREKTLLLLFRNAAAITVATLTVLIVLSQIGIDIGPLLAGAGVAGLAIGFGAQKLVQDVITGIFIQLENGMNQNDIVEVAGLFGTVEKVTIRSVVIRTMDGGYHLIPFSAIDRVSNHTRDYGYHYGEYSVSHRESVDDTIEQLQAAFQDLKQDADIAPELLGDIEIPGVTSLNEKGFTVRAMIKTTPGNQWAVQRAFNRRVKARFDAAGIEIPYPQTVVHFGRDKHGQAAPLDIHQVEKLEEVFDPDAAPGQTRRPVPGGTQAPEATS